MFTKILIANRGEIANRILRTAHRMQIACVAVYSDADATSLYVRQADAAVHIGGSAVADSYLNADAIIDAALRTGAQAIHPGYGFLSENPDFVDAVERAGLVFIGPNAYAIRAMGLKDAAKSLMEEAGVPVVPGYHGEKQEPLFLAAQAEEIGYPVLIKARAGGGGKGMRLVESADRFEEALKSASREGESAFGDPAVLVEKYITSPRHIEVQILGDSRGNVVHLYERDCSLQRRHQKVIEEAPAPGMTPAVRSAMTDAAVTAAAAINYDGAGTIEFIADGSGPLRTDGFWFMEMNTRLQVEHPVTEAITGLDLVELQLRVAAGESLPFAQSDIQMQGHAFEARLYAEDVAAGFLPATGSLQHVEFAKNMRVDTGVCSGDTITPYYDPMIAKITTHDNSREAALKKLAHSLRNTHIAGTVTNSAFLVALCEHPKFVQAAMDTGLIEKHLEQLVAPALVSETARLLARVSAMNIDVFGATCGWRLYGKASHLISLSEAQQTVERRLVLSSGGRFQLQNPHDSKTLVSVSILEHEGTRFRIEESGHVRCASVARWRDGSTIKVSVLVDGSCQVFALEDPRDNMGKRSNTANTVVAPMTGIVRLVDVSVGQAVNTDDPLLVMEAMKMETSLKAPRSGVVESLHCSVGDTVDGGSVLITLAESVDES